MLKPIAPFVQYAINYDYISKVLCINKDKPEMSCKGKCQLMQKLENQQVEDFNSLRINLKDYPIGFVKFLKINRKNNSLVFTKLKASYSNQYHFLYTFNIFHPPIS